MGSRPGRRVVVYSLEGRTMLMDVCDLLVIVLKLLPDSIKLVEWIIKKLQKTNAAPKR